MMNQPVLGLLSFAFIVVGFPLLADLLADSKRRIASEWVRQDVENGQTKVKWLRTLLSRRHSPSHPRWEASELIAQPLLRSRVEEWIVDRR